MGRGGKGGADLFEIWKRFDGGLWSFLWKKRRVVLFERRYFVFCGCFSRLWLYFLLWLFFCSFSWLLFLNFCFCN